MAPPSNVTYLSHFGLSSEPFSNAPVTRFYYESDQHKQALQRLRYALDSMKGLAVVVGDIGTGKTTLARRLLDALPEQDFEAALLVIIHAGVDATWLLKRIAMQLGVPEPADEKLALLSQLYQRLVQIYESGKKAVVLIDEVQMLATRELMEEFRGLLNLEVPERKLLSFVFFGLPEIDRVMKLDPPLRQRVALKFSLEGLSREATEKYINHRLSLAGAKRAIFTPEAIDRIYQLTGGTPRVINTLSDNVLLEGYIEGLSELDAPLVERVGQNLGLDEPIEDQPLEMPEKREASGAVKPVARAPASAAPSRADAPRAPAAAPRAPEKNSTEEEGLQLLDEPAFGTLMDNFAAAAVPPATVPPAAVPPAPAKPAAPMPAPRPAAAPGAATPRKSVNLDEIDSLLAQIRKT